MLNKEWNEKWINRARKEFENFKADIQNLGTLTVIDWRNQDGSGNWRVRYILDGCRLIITGDLGSAVFRRAEPYTLEHCSTMLKNLSYEAGKCQADGSRSGEGIYSWSYSYIEQDLNDAHILEVLGRVHNTLFNVGSYLATDASLFEEKPEWLDGHINGILP